MSMFGNLGLGDFAHNAFDGVGADAAARVHELFDPIDIAAALAATQSLRSEGLAIVFSLADAVAEEQLDEHDVLPSEFLDSMIRSACTSDDIDEDLHTVEQTLAAHVSDALSTLGVTDDVIDHINSNDTEIADAAIEAAVPLILANKPPDGDELDDFIKAFVYGITADDLLNGDDEDGFDAAHPHHIPNAHRTKHGKLAAGRINVREVNGHKIKYKATKVVRKGKVIVKNLRLAGQKIMLSMKQKAAVKHMHSLPRTHAMVRSMLRSLHVGHTAGIYKGKRAAHAQAAIKGANTRRDNHVNRMFSDS